MKKTALIVLAALVVVWFVGSGAGDTSAPGGQEYSQSIDGWYDIQHGQSRSRQALWQNITGQRLTPPPWFPLYYDVIAGKPLLILDVPAHTLLPGEVDALEQYVANGGVLLMLNSWSSHSVGSTNLDKLASRFGATLNHDIMVRNDEEAGRPSRVSSSFNTLRYNIWFDIHGLDIELGPLGANELGTISLEGEWEIQGILRGEVARHQVEARVVGDELPLDDPVVFAGRSFGHGVVIVFSNPLDWQRPAAAVLVNEMLAWAQKQASPENLLGPEQRQAWQAVFDLQLAVEELYWDYPTGLAAARMEQAWTAYVDGEYQHVLSLAAEGQQSLQRPFRPLPSRWLLALLALLLIAGGYARDNLAPWQGRLIVAASIAVFAAVLAYILSMSVVSTGQMLDFLTRVFFILAAFGLSIITRGMDWGKWLLRIAILGLALSMTYVDAIPDPHTQDRSYLEHNLLNPDSAPVRLLAEEFRNMDAAGEIDEMPYAVEDFIFRRVRYRSEDVDLHMSPVETLRYMEEDCDGIAILSASILENLGYASRVAVNHQHAWVETESVLTYRLHAPQRLVLYAFDKDGYTDLNVTSTIIQFIRKMYTGPIFLSFMLVYWPKKIDKVFFSDVFILLVLSLLIVSIPLGLANINALFIYLVFPLYYFLVRLMLGWLRQTYEVKIRVVAALMLLGTLIFGIITLISLILVMGGAGNYLVMVMLMLPLLALMAVASHGYYFDYIEHEFRLVSAVIKGKKLTEAYESTEG